MLQLVLELLILQRVDEGADAAVGEGGDDGGVVAEAVEVEVVAEAEGEEHALVGGVAEQEGDHDADHRLQRVALRSAHRGVDRRRRAAPFAPSRLRPVLQRTTQREDHARVTDGEHDDRQEVLEDEDAGAVDATPALARVERVVVAVAVDEPRGGQRHGDVKRAAEQPGGDAQPARLRRRERRVVAQRVNDGHVALDGDADQVVGGRHDGAPLEESRDPHATVHLREHCFWWETTHPIEHVRRNVKCKNAT